MECHYDEMPSQRYVQYISSTFYEPEMVDINHQDISYLGLIHLEARERSCINFDTLSPH